MDHELQASPLIVANSRGFSLVETLIAATIITGALGAVAELFTLSTRANSSARATTMAVILAQQRMEQLRGLTWGLDAVGEPTADTSTNLAVVPEAPSGGRGLSPSPSGSLADNIDGYCDFLDGRGRPLAGRRAAPPGTVYVRRWSVEPLPTNPGNTIVLQVLVTSTWSWGTTRLVSIKTRKAS